MIIRVTLEFDDEILILENQDAQAWKGIVDSQAMLAHVHGAKYNYPAWKSYKKTIAEIVKEDTSE